MGEGWGLAIVNSLTEFKSTYEVILSLSDQTTFFLGGTTNTAAGQNLEYFEYITTNRGIFNIFISKLMSLHEDYVLYYGVITCRSNRD